MSDTREFPHFKTYPELFHAYISYCAEEAYPPSKGVHTALGVEWISFYKLTLLANGTGTYKTEYFTFEPHLWSKVKTQAELLTVTPSEKVLFT